MCGCSYFSEYKGEYYSPTNENTKTLELKANGTGYSISDNQKTPITWEDPFSNHETGLKDETGYNYCYITFTNTGKTQTFFFDSEQKKDGLFTSAVGDDGMPILMLVGVKK